MKLRLILAQLACCSFLWMGSPALAERPTVQFTPGQLLRVEVANLTGTFILVERMQGGEPVDVLPGQMFSFSPAGSSINNISMLIWDERGSVFELQAIKLTNNVLRIEVRAGAIAPGDRSVYLRDDGRVIIL